MTYDYSSESKLLELPNPYRLQNRLLWLCAALLLVAGVVSLGWARNAMQDQALRLAAAAATLISFVFSWLVFGTEATRPWIGFLYFAFGLFFLLKPVLSQDRARLTTASLVGLIAVAILGPVAIGLLGPSLPQLGGFSLNTQTFVMLCTALVACALAMSAVLAQVDSAPQTRASVEQGRLSMNAPPTNLMDELDRTLQAEWTERIPNRRYARIDPDGSDA